MDSCLHSTLFLSQSIFSAQRLLWHSHRGDYIRDSSLHFSIILVKYWRWYVTLHWHHYSLFLWVWRICHKASIFKNYKKILTFWRRILQDKKSSREHSQITSANWKLMQFNRPRFRFGLKSWSNWLLIDILNPNS